MLSMKTLTIVVPAYDEEEGIEIFYRALSAECRKLSAYRTEMLFVVDGGVDGTFTILKGIAAEDPCVQVIRLSRNFGHQMALLAGIDNARTDVLISMDSDLQHPPELIPALLAEYEKGYDIVYTLRENTDNSGVVRRSIGKLFYRFINSISEVPIAENASDFRLISGRVARVISSSIRERNMFLRGIISWVGFRQTALQFTPHKRVAGTSKYSIRKLVQLALFGIISFSKKPLRAAAVAGACMALLGILFALYTVFQYFAGQISQPGFATLVLLLVFFGGVQLFFLGVIGEYIGAIFDEVKARPHYIVEEAINMDTYKPEKYRAL